MPSRCIHEYVSSKMQVTKKNTSGSKTVVPEEADITEKKVKKLLPADVCPSMCFGLLPARSRLHKDKVNGRWVIYYKNEFLNKWATKSVSWGCRGSHRHPGCLTSGCSCYWQTYFHQP